MCNVQNWILDRTDDRYLYPFLFFRKIIWNASSQHAKLNENGLVFGKVTTVKSNLFLCGPNLHQFNTFIN